MPATPHVWSLGAGVQVGCGGAWSGSLAHSSCWQRSPCGPAAPAVLTGRCPSPSEHRDPGTEAGELLGVSIPPVLEDQAQAQLDRSEPADFQGGSALPRPHWDKKAWPISGLPLVFGGLAQPLQP